MVNFECVDSFVLHQDGRHLCWYTQTTADGEVRRNERAYATLNCVSYSAAGSAVLLLCTWLFSVKMYVVPTLPEFEFASCLVTAAVV